MFNIELSERLIGLGQSLIFSDDLVTIDSGAARSIIGDFYQDPGPVREQTVDATAPDYLTFLDWCLNDGIAELEAEGYPATILIVAVLYYCARYSMVLVNDPSLACGTNLPRGTFSYELNLQADGSGLLWLHSPFYEGGQDRIYRFVKPADSIKHIAAGIH